MATPVEPSTTPSAIAAAERPFQFRLVHLLVAVTIVGAVLALLVPAWRAAREAALRSSCRNNLQQLMVGLHNYHDVYGQFPPAHLCDATGKPAHSWRLLIWPFLGAQPYYSQYNFAEPWNGPTNSKLHAVSMPLYRCPGDRSSPPGMTNYVAIVGKGTVWPAPRSVDIADIAAGTSTTLMIVEIAHSDIHWIEPRDLPVEELAARLDPQHRPQLLGNHIGGGMVAYADGHVEMLSRDVTIERLKALVTAAGKDNR